MNDTELCDALIMGFLDADPDQLNQKQLRGGAPTENVGINCGEKYAVCKKNH
jgi:hypothetical protein